MHIVLVSIFFSVVCVLGVGAYAQPAPDSKSVATVVLVHGAFAESSSWNGVIPLLHARGHKVIAVALPLRGLRSDANYVTAILKSIEGPVVLVGHSYGGSVITNAAHQQPNVKALVYIDGAVPDSGESTASVSAPFPGGTLASALAPPITLPNGDQDLYIDQAKYRNQFAADVPEDQTTVMAVTQRPITQAALNEASGVPAWRDIPSWFIYGQLDKNIPPAAHAYMAKRAGAIESIEVKGASHVVMVSHPNEVAQLIERAASAPWKKPVSAEPVRSEPKAGESPRSSFDPAPVITLATQTPAHLVVDSPLPEQLARGYVVVRYRAENLRIMPVYGPDALNVLPRLGHLHITMDDEPWHWLDSSGEPISINGLMPGKHKLLIELETPTHQAIDSKTIHFDIPSRQS